VVNKRAWKERWDQLEREYLNEQITLRGHLASQTIAGKLQGSCLMLNGPSVSCGPVRTIQFAPVWPRPGLNCLRRLFLWSIMNSVSLA
jgi:hypothetical protein